MHDPLETQQQHDNENDPKVDVDGEVNKVPVETEKAVGKEGQIELGNQKRDETGTGAATEKGVDRHGAETGMEPMDVEPTKAEDDPAHKSDDMDVTDDAGEHASQNGGKENGTGSGESRRDGEQPEASPAVVSTTENDAAPNDRHDKEQAAENSSSLESGVVALTKPGDGEPVAAATEERPNEEKEGETKAMEGDGKSTGDNDNSAEDGAAAMPESKPRADGTGNGGTASTAESNTTQQADGASGGGAVASGTPAAAAPPPTPPPPVLKGTLSYNVEQRRHIIRGMWNYENSKAFPPQRFELIRNLNPDEDAKELPKNGEFHGSFSLAYYHTTSKGKQKERSKVIPESGVKITFTKIDGKEQEFKVDGEGTNQFGIFNINGTATPSAHEGDPSYNIELRKRYKPTPASVHAAGAAGAATGSGSKKSKKNKKRKHSLVGSSAAPDDDEGAQADGDDGQLPPPSQSYASHVICLRGKLSREQSEDLGVTEVVHRISGMWSSGLDLILADPQNLRGLCNRFEYEHKMSLGNDVFPLSGRYTGWFDLTQQDGARTRISERDVTLKFRKNNAGYYNVEGRGSNSFGKYRITGTLSSENILTIFRHFQPLKTKKTESSKASGSVTAAPPPLQSSGRPGKQQAAQTPALPVLTLDQVEVPGGDKPGELPNPIPLPAHGTYSAVSRGVLRLDGEGAHICAGKWAMTREHFHNGTTSSFSFRLEKHFVDEAVKAMADAKKGDAADNDASAPDAFPVDSAMYKGSFHMRRGATKYQKIIDQQIVLKFRKNSAGSYNVMGKGVNNIGPFALVGTFVESGNKSGHIDLYRMYPVVPKPASAPGAGKGLATAGKPGTQPKRPSANALPTTDSAGKPVDGTVPPGIVPGTSTMLPGPPRIGSLQRRESSRLVKLPSRLEDDDPEAQMVRIMEKCVVILKFMHEKDLASGSFFSDPVDPLALGIPTYHEVITEPMDLGTIKRRMDAHEITTPEEFARLVRLVFENAMTFNVEPTHAVHQAGRNLLILFNQKFRDVERMVENIRRSHKPSEAELRTAERERKKREKEEAKRAKKQAKEDKKRKLSGGEPGKASKRTRLEEAQALAAANVTAMAAIRAAAPPNGGNITRVEFNLLLQMMQQLQGQVAQLHLSLARASSEDGPVANPTGETGYTALPDMRAVMAAPEKKRPSKKKNETRVDEKVDEMPVFDELKPLTLKEQEVLTDTINRLASDRLQGVIDIIRESATLNGDEDEIDLEIDQLDTATQRKLQKYVLKNVKQPRRSKPKAPKKTKAAARPTPQPKTTPKASTAPQSKPTSTTPQNSFFAFGSKGDSDSDSDSDSDVPANQTAQGSTTAAPKDDFHLGDGFGASLQEDDDDDDIGNGGLAANWTISKPVAQSASTDGTDEASDGGKDLWGAAREKAAASKARDAERKALEDKIRADAEIAKDRRLAEAAARGDEIRMQREEEEAKAAAQQEQQEREAEEAKKAARDALRAQVQAVEQTVDLDAQRDIMKQYEQSFLDKELGGGASPSSDFGF